MYAIHSTTGFIVDSRAYGEAGKLISIFTRDFGMVTAVAQGIRLEKSKLRYSTQDYSFGTFSLVRGKELWRLTSADAARGGTELTARIALLLRRLLQGEEAHPALFESLECYLAFIRDHAGLGEEDMKTLESIVVLQIMHALGYVGSGDGLEVFVKPSGLRDADLLIHAKGKRVAINKHINKALKESHL